LDYHEFATLKRHPDLASCLESLGLRLGAPASPDAPRLYAFTTKGSQPFHEVRYRPGDAFLFGPESRGLPDEVRNAVPEAQRVRLPVRPGCRSLNLSNTVAVAVYGAWR